VFALPLLRRWLRARMNGYGLACHVGQSQDDWIEVFGARVLPQLRQAPTGTTYGRRAE